MTPGSSGNGASAAAAASSAVKPGLTPNCAPALLASTKSRGRVSVPTPTIASGTALRIASIAGRHAGVRNVTSSTRSPPAHKRAAERHGMVDVLDREDRE